MPTKPHTLTIDRGCYFNGPGDTSIMPGPNGWTIQIKLERDYDTRPDDFPDAYDVEEIDAWKDDQWMFLGVVASATRGDERIAYLAAVWSVESTDEDHLEAVALEVGAEAFAALEAREPAKAAPIPDGFAVAKRGSRMVVLDAYGVALAAAEILGDTLHDEARATTAALAAARGKQAPAPGWVERAAAAMGWTPPQVADAWASGDLTPPPDVRRDVAAYLESVVWARGFGHRLRFAS